MASTYLSRAKSTPTSTKIFTASVWVKKTGNDTTNGHYIIDSQGGTSGAESTIAFEGTQKLRFGEYSGGNVFNTVCDARFKDIHGWMHIVVAGDSTQATASDRVKIYVNGELQSVANSYPSQNHEFRLCRGSSDFDIGRWQASGGRYFDGSMAHFHFIDGTAYDADDFGETDSTTGIWKPKTSPSVTYGNNGFFLKFENTSDFGEDSSGNDNDFTVSNGTITQTIDTPSNVFATGNRLYYFNGAYGGYSNGNNTKYTGSGSTGVDRATLGASAGKYYWEVKIGASNGAGNIWQGVGIIGEPQTSDTDELGNGSYGYGYWGQDGTIRNNNSNIATYNTFTTNDIISVALDMDNNKLYFAKNGTWQNSADPAAGTNGISINTNPTDGFYFPAWGDWDNNNRFYFYLNFGNGYFGTTAVSSAGTNAGVGTFEYDVPSGFKALCTKNINAQEYS